MTLDNARLAVAMLLGLISPVHAQTRAIAGQAGLLAEWDLAATVTEQTEGEWAGPLVMKHVGFCGIDGPEEKTGELRLRMPSPGGEMAATLLIDGVVCSFKAQGKNGYDGVMRCPDRREVPMMLSIP